MASNLNIDPQNTPLTAPSISSHSSSNLDGVTETDLDSMLAEIETVLRDSSISHSSSDSQEVLDSSKKESVPFRTPQDSTGVLSTIKNRSLLTSSATNRSISTRKGGTLDQSAVEKARESTTPATETVKKTIINVIGNSFKSIFSSGKKITSQQKAQSLLSKSAKNETISGKEYLKAANSLQKKLAKDPINAATAHTLYEKAAIAFTAEGNIKEAFNARIQASLQIPFAEDHPLQNLQSTERKTTPPDLTFGTFLSGFGGGVVKGGHLRLKIPNEEQIKKGKQNDILQFKMSQHSRENVDQTLKTLSNIENFQELVDALPEGFSFNSVEILTKKQNDSIGDNSIQHYLKGEPVSKTVIVFSNGDNVVGRVHIGNDKSMSLLHNSVRVEVPHGLPEGESLTRMHQMLTVLGAGPVLSNQRPEDTQRMQVAQIFRTYFPAKALEIENTEEFYDLPIDELKAKISTLEPKMQAILKKYEDNPDLLEEKEIFPGRKVWTMSDIADQMRTNGSIGLMSSVGNSLTKIETAANHVTKILQNGLVSSYERLYTDNPNFITDGASSAADITSGGADRCFTRQVNKNNISRPLTEFGNLAAKTQSPIYILYDLEVLNRGGWGQNQDTFGVKNPAISGDNKWPNGVSYDMYKNRQSIIDFAGVKNEIADDPEEREPDLNEVMIKDRVGPEFIKGLVVRDDKEKQILIASLKKSNITNIGGKTLDEAIHVADKFNNKFWE